MTRTISYILIAVFIIGVIPEDTSALKTLSNQELKHATAQAGIDISVDGMISEYYNNHLTFADPDDESEYIRLNNIHILSEANTGSSDLDNSGTINHLEIDLGTYNNRPMLFAESHDLSISTDLTIDSIDFAGTDIGALSLQSMLLSSFHLYMGPHMDGTGVDYEMGLKMGVDRFSFQYNTTDSLVFSGVAFDVQLGNLSASRPATIDISGDTSSICLNMPMTGSFRIDNIQVLQDTTIKDLGLFALDGINVQKLYIEIPGRGLGNP